MTHSAASKYTSQAEKACNETPSNSPPIIHADFHVGCYVIYFFELFYFYNYLLITTQNYNLVIVSADYLYFRFPLADN